MTDALLIIDMQLVAFDGQVTPAIIDGDSVVNATVQLLAVCRRAGLHIIYIQTRAISGQPYAEDVHGWQIHPDLTVLDTDTLVYKQDSSGFAGTNLHDVLSGLEVRSFIACGIWSQFCVANTAKDGLALGYEVYLAADAHGTVADSESEARAIVAEQNQNRQFKVYSVSELQQLLN